MRFSVRLNREAAEVPDKYRGLGKVLRDALIQWDLRFWGLSDAMVNQPAVPVLLSGKSGNGKVALNDGFELLPGEIDIFTKLEIAMGGLKRNLVFGAMALVAVLSPAGAEKVFAENTSAIVRLVAADAEKSMSPVILDYDLEQLYKNADNQALMPLIMARSHINTVGSHTNIHTDTNVGAHVNLHTNNTGTNYHSNTHTDHVNVSHTNTPGHSHANTVHSDGLAHTNATPQHQNYNWENVAHTNVQPHVNITGTNITNDYVY